MKNYCFRVRPVGSFLLLCFFLSILPRPIYATEITEPTITASAALVMEASTGKILFSKNPDSWLVPASFTKVMTAYIVFEEIYAGNLSYDTLVPVTKAHSELASSFYNMTKEKFTAYTSVSVEKLLQMILIPSSCAACVIIADYIAGSEEAFVKRMNQTAERLSMDAEYENCHGLWTHYLTAKAQARLLQVFLQQFPQVLGFTALTSTTYNGTTHNSTNLLLLDGNYYYPDADGFKTGSTQSAGYNLCATAMRDGVRIISVVMKGSGNASCFGASQDLLDYGFAVMAAGEPPFHDSSYHPQSADLFERYRKLGVNLQARNGWVRPIEEITRGEFALLLVELLQVHGYLEKLNQAPSNLPVVEDLQNYFGKEQILRGIALGFFPFTQESENFSPNSLLTPEEMEQIFVMTESALGISTTEQPSFTESPEVWENPDTIIPEQASPEQASPEQASPEQASPEQSDLPLWTPETDTIIPGVQETEEVKIPIRWAVLSTEDWESQVVRRGAALLAIEARLFL